MEQLTGSIVALVTPMHEDGSVDYPALRRLIDWHIAEGTDCIGVVGTTGESPTVDVEEHCEIIRVSVEQARGRVPDHGRLRRQLHQGSDRARQVRQGRRRRLAAAGRALLQQADAGRPVPALQGHRRGGGRPADRALQRARPHGRRYGARHRAAPGAGARHRRHQGSHRQHRARAVADPRRAQGLRRVLGRRPDRRRADAVRRPGQHQRHGQRGAAPDARAVRGGDRRRRQARDADPVRADAAAPPSVRRAQSDSGQVGDGAHGPVRRRAAPAADRRSPKPAEPVVEAALRASGLLKD